MVASTKHKQLTRLSVVGKVGGNRETAFRGCELNEDNPLSPTNFVCVCSAKTHFLCLDENGVVFSCGKGIAGQLGLGEDKRTSTSLSRVTLPLSAYITSVFCKFAQSAAISKSGEVYVWGCGFSASWVPQPYTIPRYDIIDCALGNSHILVRAYPSKETTKSTGRVYGFGDNRYGQIAMEEASCSSFMPITALDHISVVSIACGFRLSVAVSLEGYVYYWGSLDGTTTKEPTLIENFGNPDKIISSTCGSNSAVFLSESGKFFQFGYYFKEDGTKHLLSVPTAFQEFASRKAIQISSCGDRHSVLIKEERSFITYVWGDLSDDSKSSLYAPTPVQYEFIPVIKRQMLQIALGGRFLAMITDHRKRSESNSHSFLKIQMNLPTRCQVCSHFAFGLRLWKCAKCGLICHNKCKDEQFSICEPQSTAHAVAPISSTISDRPKKSSTTHREIEEQEAQVMRCWAKAQCDFASDFVRHVSSTRLRDMAPGITSSPSSTEIVSTKIEEVNSATSPGTEPIRVRRTRTKSNSRRIKNMPKDNTPLAISSSSSSILEENYIPESADEAPCIETEHSKKVQIIQAKLIHYRRKVSELEEELSLLLDANSTSIKSTNTSLPTTSTTISIPTPSNYSSTPKAPERSTRPSERMSLSKSNLSIDKSWTIDPSQVEINKVLGEGASALVYLGKYRGQDVAIKVMKDQVGSKRLMDFQFEYHILREMKSKYNVYFFGACLNPNLCLLMEFCERGSLYSCLNDPNLSIRWSRLLKIALEMCSGVSYLHSWEPQIVHRDLKSHNLLIDINWSVKLADFGLARLNTGSFKKSTMGKLRGTYAYCAPEIYYGSSFTPQSDVFSIGVILWELVVRVIKGRYDRPYSEFPELEYDYQVIVQTARGKRCTIPPTTPIPVSKLIQACWDPDPKRRPSSKDLVSSIQNLHREYRANQEAWDWAIL